MKNAKMILMKLLYPPKWVLFLIPPMSFTALALIFASENTESVSAYVLYCLSAYSLTVWILATPKLIRKMKATVADNRTVQRIRHSEFGSRYFGDLAFRGSISIYQGMTINFLYVIFRIAAGIRYTSVWFISMAVYYLVLGALRAHLIFSYRHRDTEREIRCYRQTAWLLFLLNIPMGGMILLMVRTNSGYSYPGYIIYLSAMYTFYTMTMSIINLVKFRKLGSPILSAAKVLNFISAMMSILGLQTAMIAQFSANEESYRRMMNTITGGVVYGIVIAVAIYMLLHSRSSRKKVESVE